MEWKLPELKTDVDCDPIGYPGLVFRFWLNATNPAEDWEEPENPEPWDRLWYVGLARVLQRVTVPAEYTGGEEACVIDIANAKDVYDLEQMPGFEQTILHWAFGVLGKERQERLAAERKN